MRFWLAVLVLLFGVQSAPAQPAATRVNDLEAARELFERNLDAIRNHDATGYLACYWQSPRFTRNGNQGPSFGYADWAETVGEGWPEVFDAKAMQLTWITEGVVYGSYRYRVVFDGQESTGMSERLFLNTDAGWRIAVSTAFQNPGDVPPPPLVLTGADVWTGEGNVREDAVISIKDGVLACVGSCGVSADADVIDLRGLTVVPDITRLGIVAEGSPAHLLVLDGDPLTDPLAWTRVKWIVTAGELRAVR